MAAEMLDDRAFEAIAPAVAGRRNLPVAVEEQRLGLVGKLIVLRTQHDTDRTGDGRQLDAVLGRAARRPRREFIARLQRSRIGTTQPRALIDCNAAEGLFSIDAALDCEIAERATPCVTERQRLAIANGH